MGGRRKARELVLQACYAHELSQNPPEMILETMILSSVLDDANKEFAARLFSQTVRHMDELNGFIKGKAANWELDRIAIIDRIVLRMAICEFLYFEDIPPKVSIDEAIEIAKKYSTENSGRFVNGILDAVLNDLRKSGRLPGDRDLEKGAT
ncbi:MAG: transcription antitermination factor NusB [candidate division KSB1 bacterium]|nr:transcription antitermination factor NusB [candidate division KSB1 bacterium]